MRDKRRIPTVLFWSDGKFMHMFMPFRNAVLSIIAFSRQQMIK